MLTVIVSGKIIRLDRFEKKFETQNYIIANADIVHYRNSHTMFRIIFVSS